MKLILHRLNIAPHLIIYSNIFSGVLVEEYVNGRLIEMGYLRTLSFYWPYVASSQTLEAQTRPFYSAYCNLIPR